VADESNDKTTEEAPETEAAPEHKLKADVRGAVAKAVGMAVEAGSMLAGYSGEGVSADREIAEADAEEFIDRIDGEG
jgi:hypothetical protein